MPRPLIGITTYREQAHWGSWHAPAVLLPVEYAEAVAGEGGEPVLLATGATSVGVVAHLDGLLLTGGADVGPSAYGQDPGSHATVLRPDRDAAELGALRAALGRRLPVLAVCRGMQLLNVALGGDLHQHLPDLPGAGVHDPGPGRYTEREVHVEPGTMLARLLGARATAHCHHHQALDRIAVGLRVSARAEDGTVEAVEAADPDASPAQAFCLAVQWHPEAGEDRRLFAAHVRAARDRHLSNATVGSMVRP